jgi:hypothetical protein
MNLRLNLTSRPRRAAAELALLVAAGLVMGFIGPFGTETAPQPLLYLYWQLCIVGGGVIGIAIDEALGRRLSGFWPRLLASSVTMTPFVTLLVIQVGRAVFGAIQRPPDVPVLLGQVLVISVVVMGFRALAWRERPALVKTRVVVAPPLPEAEAAFRQRLSAKRRTARLIAVEAYDHYLRVHTDAGPELVTLRFADAMQELAGAHGLQIHRSWWVAADAIEAVQWRRGAGEARLAGDLSAPVSRTYAPALKAAGWF